MQDIRTQSWTLAADFALMATLALVTDALSLTVHRLPGPRSLPVAMALIVGSHALPRPACLTLATLFGAVSLLWQPHAAGALAWLVPALGLALVPLAMANRWQAALLAGATCGVTLAGLGGTHATLADLGAHVAFGVTGALVGHAFAIRGVASGLPCRVLTSNRTCEALDEFFVA
jgi:hypothetical protein